MSSEMDPRTQKLKEMGASIRTKRESLGLSIEDVRDKTLIRRRYLVAVEEGDDSIAPGKVYFKGFLKSYAAFVGLDGFAYSRAYQEMLDESEAVDPHRLRRQSAPTQSGIPSYAMAATPASPASRAPEEAPQGAPEASREESAATRAPAATDPSRKAAVPSIRSDSDYRALRQHRQIQARKRGNSALLLFLLALALVAGGYYLISSGVLGGKTPPTGVVEPDPSESGEPSQPVQPEPGGPEEPVAPVLPAVTRSDPNRERTVWECEAPSLSLALSVLSEEDSECWLQVLSDGENVYEGTLLPGGALEFEAEGEIEILAGKPWCVILNLNGVDLGPGGVLGPVKKLVFRVS